MNTLSEPASLAEYLIVFEVIAAILIPLVIVFVIKKER